MRRLIPGWFAGIASCASLLLSLCAGTSVASPHTAPITARSIDHLLSTEVAKPTSADHSADQPSAPQADDETYLRRVYLDLIGEQPPPEEITAFVLDAGPDKRHRVVDRLLEDPRYGRNWARYWRDVVLYRRNDPRALVASQSLTNYLAEEFNRGASWREIAESFVTARGLLAENGRTGMLAAQWGEVSDTAAEVSRILMGVQIQCAQCHDHKTDRWKRTQFHELAAFFPRITIRLTPNEDPKQREFELAAKEGPAKPKKLKPEQAQKAKQRLEHYMPDLEHPAAEGTLMQPVFFLTGQKLPLGASDEERRAKLAEWITSPDNPWFARAVVNRIWAELVGEGFYEPVDDLGPDKTCTAPRTLDLLADQFVMHNYDLKWLFRTITATEIYGGQSRQRRNSNQQAFACVCPQPLRADQVYNNLSTALHMSDDVPAGDKARNPAQAAARLMNSPRGRFIAAFGYDPSAPRDEMSGSIDQALLMMNTPSLARAISVNEKGRDGATLLAELLSSGRQNDEIVLELYLRCLAREPKPGELATCREYLHEIKNRREAFEDILWSLVNSTEFLYRQ